MNKELNILITTLGITNDLTDVSYFHYKDKLGNYEFCTGISNAEAGTKYMLSHNKIDRIYVLGPRDLVKRTDWFEVRNAEIPTVIDESSVDEFEFYCYRISQFLNHLDIEADDILFGQNQERRKALEDKANQIIDGGWEGQFYHIATDDEEYGKYKRFTSDNATENEARVLKYGMYSKMDSHFKMCPIKANDSITVRYIGVDLQDSGRISVTSMFEVIEKLFKNKNTSFNIFVDSQGMDRADSTAVWNTLSMYQSMRESIILKGVMCTQTPGNRFTSVIANEEESYNTGFLLAAIRAFMRYGKSELLEDYVARSGLKNRNLKNILVAMRYVNTGVSLNNINDLKTGIQIIRNLKSVEKNDDDMTDQERFVFTLICKLIQDDYGPMLTTPELELADLIDWTIRKGFIQQALTMVEALVPEDLVKKGIYYYAQNIDQMYDLARSLNVKYWSDEPRNRFGYNDIDHQFIKYYGRDAMGYVRKDRQPSELAKLKIRMLHEELEGFVLAHSNLGDEKLLYELLMNYYALGNLRNSVSHAGFEVKNMTSLDEIDENTRIEEVTKALNIFMGLYRSACNKIRKKEGQHQPKPVILASDRFRSFANKHRLYDMPMNDYNHIKEQNVQCVYNGNALNIRLQLREVQEDEPE